jgi:hypothetical protein
MFLIPIRPLTVFATHQLATVDYTVANRVTDDVAHVGEWAYQNNLPWVSSTAVHLLQQFDGLGGVLIAFVVWLVDHTS